MKGTVCGASRKKESSFVFSDVEAECSRSFKSHYNVVRTGLFGFEERGSLVEKLDRRRRRRRRLPGFRASEDTYEGEDVPTGFERRQRTAREVFLLFLSGFIWGV